MKRNMRSTAFVTPPSSGLVQRPFPIKSNATCVKRKNHLILLVKIVIVATCASLLIVQASKCFERYLNFDTTAILSVKPTGDATFLAFTICPAFEAGYKDEVLAKYGIVEKNYQKGQYAPAFNPSNHSHVHIFNEATYDLDEILEEIQLKTSDQSKTQISVPFEKSNLDSSIALWHTNYHQLYGRCYTMAIQGPTAMKEVTQVEIVSFINIFVFLHHPGQFSDFNSKTKMQSKVGESLFIDLTYEITINSLGEDSVIPCNDTMNMAFDACLSYAVVERLAFLHGCSLPYLPLVNGAEVCDPTEKEVLNNAYADYDFFTSNGQKQLCERPCATMEVFSGLPVTGTMYNGRALLKMYLKSTTKIKKMILDYTPISMIAEIGGYTGLLLGVSFVNITHVLDRFIQKCSSARD